MIKSFYSIHLRAGKNSFVVRNNYKLLPLLFFRDGAKPQPQRHCGGTGLVNAPPLGDQLWRNRPKRRTARKDVKL